MSSISRSILLNFLTRIRLVEIAEKFNCPVYTNSPKPDIIKHLVYQRSIETIEYLFSMSKRELQYINKQLDLTYSNRGKDDLIGALMELLPDKINKPSQDVSKNRSTKIKDILNLFSKTELIEFASRCNIHSLSALNKPEIILKIIKTSGLTIPEILLKMTNDELRDVCYAYDLPYSNKSKGELIETIIPSRKTVKKKTISGAKKTKQSKNPTHTSNTSGKRKETQVKNAAVRINPVEKIIKSSNKFTKPLGRIYPMENVLEHKKNNIPPQVGMLATLRNRRGIISSVEPFSGPDGVLNMVTVEYVDGDGELEEHILWEVEAGANVIKPASLPDIDSDPPMKPDEFEAMVRAARWSAISPYIDPDGTDGPLTEFPISSPLHGAIQAEDFQIMPLLKAMQMPRISLLIADDVGLGKTIEAGLILSELIIRRRARRVLILSPASLKTQWMEEMYDKFSIRFDIVDRDSSNKLKKKMGMDTNPWRTFSKAIASYHYLKQPDVLEQFIAASQQVDGVPHLPWDLLIVDEAHNLSPASFGEQSELSKMLSIVAPLFEHKLFLTATPHNGHTASFTGLLEKLDPVRFHKTSELKGAMKARVEQVLVRRLKTEINARTNPPRFCSRSLTGLKLNLSDREKVLSEGFRVFRKKIKSLIAKSKKSEQLAGSFAIEVLGKRLLSCPATFADSWWRYLDGMKDPEEIDSTDVNAAVKLVREETDDDLEAESRTKFAVSTVGAWLKPFGDNLKDEINNITEALIDLDLKKIDDEVSSKAKDDSRLDALFDFINTSLRNGKDWKYDERLVIFTEYKTTLDYLTTLLENKYGSDGCIRILYGGMDSIEREDIKHCFNDPADQVRILIGTDAASEGLNLQHTARYILHYDVPWNPSRLEQRNGRLDRHGQARDVTVHHFKSDDDADIKFLFNIVKKVDTIRDDLGSVGEVFDSAMQKRFIEDFDEEQINIRLDEVIKNREDKLSGLRDKRVSIKEEKPVVDGKEEKAEAERLVALKAEIDFTDLALKNTLETSLAIGACKPKLVPTDEKGRFKLTNDVPPPWQHLIDDSLRQPERRGVKGALKGLIFKPEYFMDDCGGRPVFRPRPDTALMHLAHPMLQKTISGFARLRFPGTGAETKATRWITSCGCVPEGVDILVLLTIEELAVNELRETFHHWVRTYQFPVINNQMGEMLPHQPALLLNEKPSGTHSVDDARDIWEDIGADIKDRTKELASNLTKELETALSDKLTDARKYEIERFQSRQGEISAHINEMSIQRLTNEIEKESEEIKHRKKQTALWSEEDRIQELEKKKENLEEELKRRKVHYEELRNQLDKDRKRVLEHILPKRHKMRGEANCFPVAIEIRFSEGK